MQLVGWQGCVILEAGAVTGQSRSVPDDRLLVLELSCSDRRILQAGV
jgi:hypothetical protein